MYLNEERQEDLIYKESKNKVVAFLNGKDSEMVTKLVQKYEKADALLASAKVLRAQAAEQHSQAKEIQNQYADELRNLDEKLFNTTTDMAKTKVIQSLQFLIKLSKKPEATETHSVDWEKVTHSLAEMLNIPITVLEEAINKHTEIMIMEPKVRLYKPERLEDGHVGKPLDESFIGDIFTNLKNSITKTYTKLLSKFNLFDNLMERLTTNYLK